MKTEVLQSWESFESAIDEVRQEYGEFRAEAPDGRSLERRNRVLFRGQSDETWPLRTTLERKLNRQIDVTTYAGHAAQTVFEIETYTGARWNVPPRPELEQEIQDRSNTFDVHLPNYDFLVYLRHHGFASPLLDWTESPYIAAYFAYAEAGSADRAVYCYIERPRFIKGGLGGAPTITVRGPFVRTDKRHFAQKAWYTTATRWDYSVSRHVFCSHEAVFDRDDPKQDVLVKLILPAGDRVKALRRLDEFNINHFTLFQSEDALIRALDLKVFDLGQN
ncbi:MAG: FRG domain-containing protein [Reyranella sp.]